MREEFDHRNHVRLDHGMPENPKVVGLSDAAFRLYVEAICWCSRQETDGVIPDGLMRRLGRPKVIAELIGARLLTSGDGRYEVHDYLMFQRSAQEISAYRASKGKAGVKGNHERWHVARSRRDPGCPLCLSSVAS